MVFSLSYGVLDNCLQVYQLHYAPEALGNAPLILMLYDPSIGIEIGSFHLKETISIFLFYIFQQ